MEPSSPSSSAMTGQKRHFDAVPQDVLPVAGAVVQRAEHPDDLVVQAADIDFFGGFFADLDNPAVYVFFRLVDDLLNAGRVNTPILNQSLHTQTGNLAADGIKAADDNDAGGVIDNHVNTGRLFKRPNVPSLAADDPTLHIVTGDIHHRNTDFTGLLGGVSLNRQIDDFFGLFLGLLLGLGNLTLNQLAHFAVALILQTLEKQFAGLFDIERSDFQELILLLCN